MINHIRTLLLNQPRGAYGPDFPGEEYVPATYRARSLPTSLRKARAVLFGADPDRYMLNYRLRQLLPVLHETELEEYVLEKDSRTTYWPLRGEEFFRGAFGTTIDTLNNLGSPLLTPIGELLPHEEDGRLHHRWHVTVISATNVEVKRIATPLQEAIYSYTLTDNLSNQIPLLGSSLSFVFRGGVGSEWIVEIVARPRKSTGDLLAALKRSLTEVDEIQIFGTVNREPFLTLRNLWRRHDKYPYQLGALLLALALRTEEQ